MIASCIKEIIDIEATLAKVDVMDTTARLNFLNWLQVQNPSPEIVHRCPICQKNILLFSGVTNAHVQAPEEEGSGGRKKKRTRNGRSLKA
jgi:hypothetical protein